jgi:hypothetical protein
MPGRRNADGSYMAVDHSSDESLVADDDDQDFEESARATRSKGKGKVTKTAKDKGKGKAKDVSGYHDWRSNVLIDVAILAILRLGSSLSAFLG